MIDKAFRVICDLELNGGLRIRKGVEGHNFSFQQRHVLFFLMNMLYAFHKLAVFLKPCPLLIGRRGPLTRIYVTATGNGCFALSHSARPDIVGVFER